MQAWHHLEHFFSSLFGSKEFWAAILGAVFGGLMTGWFALLTQKQAAKDQRTRDRETESETVKGTLEAIATEVEIFKRKFLDSFERIFKESDLQAPPANPVKVVRMNQSLFSVFDSNAAILGRVTDADLRRKIVATYLTLKAIVDIVNYYAERRASWESIRHQPSIGGGLLEAKGEVQMWAGNIQRMIPDLQTEIAELLRDIRKYLDGRN